MTTINLEVRFERALEQLWIAFQPIVDWKNRTLFGYEALVRSREATLGTPALLIDAAERLHRVRDLGRTIRGKVAGHIPDATSDLSIFVNLHALDLEDPNLHDPRARLSEYAHRVVLEVTERTSLDGVRDVSSRISNLRQLGYRLAVDDLGAGYAGLSCVSRLEPDIAKLDMSLIQGIDASARMQSLVRSMLNLCNSELGIRIVCEGVETPAERDVLNSLGADLLQGNLIGLPAPAFPAVRLSGPNSR